MDQIKAQAALISSGKLKVTPRQKPPPVQPQPPTIGGEIKKSLMARRASVRGGSDSDDDESSSKIGSATGPTAKTPGPTPPPPPPPQHQPGPTPPYSKPRALGTPTQGQGSDTPVPPSTAEEIKKDAAAITKPDLRTIVGAIASGQKPLKPVDPTTPHRSQGTPPEKNDIGTLVNMFKTGMSKNAPVGGGGGSNSSVHSDWSTH